MKALLLAALLLVPVRALGEPPKRSDVQARVAAQHERTKSRAAEQKRERDARRVARDLELGPQQTRRFVKLQRR